MVLVKFLLKVKLERISTTLKCQSWENYAYLDLWELWGFYSRVELTFVSWWRRYILVEKILINARILWDSFLVKIPLIRAQDIPEVKLSQAGPIDFFTPIDHLPRPSGIMVRLSAYGVAAFVLHIRMKLTGLWEPSTSLCVTH